MNVHLSETLFIGERERANLVVRSSGLLRKPRRAIPYFRYTRTNFHSSVPWCLSHCWRAGATHLGICRCITCRQRTACFPFVKQDRSTCLRYMRTVYIDIARTVSRWVERYLSCTFEPWGLGRGTASVSHRRLQRMPWNRGEFSLARSIRAFREAACAKM